MTREEAKEFLINISYQLGNMGVEYLTTKDGEKMRAAIETLEQEIVIEADKTIDCNNDGWCNTCEYKHLESKCVGCAKYDEYDNLISLSKYKKESGE